MATVGRKKRKRSRKAGTGVGVKPHTRSPRGPDYAGGKRKRTVRVDPYSRGKPKGRKTKSGVDKRKRSRRKKKR